MDVAGVGRRRETALPVAAWACRREREVAGMRNRCSDFWRSGEAGAVAWWVAGRQRSQNPSDLCRSGQAAGLM